MNEMPHAFDVANKEAWLRQVQKELNGADPASLAWEHPELGSIPPYFNREDAPVSLPLPPRSYSAQTGEWEMVQRFEFGSDSNASVLQSLMHGCSGLRLILNDSASPDEHRALLQGVFLNMVSLHLEGSPSAQRECINLLSEGGEPLTGSAGIDAVRMAIENGNAFDHQTALFEHFSALQSLQPQMRSVAINANAVFEAGGGDAFELAYALHSAHHCLETLLSNGVSIDQATAAFQFKVSAGQSYFVTIAKFRALRYLWAKIVSEYAPQHDCSMVTWIHAETSQRQYGLRDVHSNLLRNTTAAMAAIAGGCDSLEITEHTPWDINEDTRRWARNIHHLLRDESGFGMVIDQAAASYYIDYLSNAIIEKTLSYVNALEQRGGIVSEAGKQWFSDALQKQRDVLVQRWESGADKVVGTTIFPPKDEKIATTNWPLATGSVFDRLNCASILQKQQEA